MAEMIKASFAGIEFEIEKDSHEYKQFIKGREKALERAKNAQVGEIQQGFKPILNQWHGGLSDDEKAMLADETFVIRFGVRRIEESSAYPSSKVKIEKVKGPKPS